MNAALREGARAFFNEIGTPHDAPARRMLERSSFTFDLENPLRVDNCEQCGAIHWRDCCCDPSSQSEPSSTKAHEARRARLMRHELDCEERLGRVG